MTGDGAVVREPFKLDEAEIAKAREAADQLRCGYAPGGMSVPRLRYLGHLERQQAAEIERLTEQARLAAHALSDEQECRHASEARTADLLKALERYGEHKHGCPLALDDDGNYIASDAWLAGHPRECDCGLAAAKGETV